MIDTDTVAIHLTTSFSLSYDFLIIDISTQSTISFSFI